MIKPLCARMGTLAARHLVEIWHWWGWWSWTGSIRSIVPLLLVEPTQSWFDAKDPITGRGRCEHCDASVHHQFGRRMYWDMRDFELNALLDYNEQSLATKGVCGCTVFINKFACSRCNKYCSM